MLPGLVVAGLIGCGGEPVEGPSSSSSRPPGQAPTSNRIEGPLAPHHELPPAPPEQIITADALMETVRLLADPALEGRLAGTPGYDRAAQQAADRMRTLGLEPLGENGDENGEWLHPFTLEANRIRACELEVPGWRIESPQLGTAYACRGFTGSGGVTAPVTFVGYGLSLPDLGYDDYAGVDVTGRIALAFKQAPTWTLGDEGWGDHPLPRPKALAARAHGAVGLLLVDRTDLSWGGGVIGSMLHGPGEHPRQFPQLQVEPAIARWLLAPVVPSLAQAQERIDSAKKPATFHVDREVRIRVRADYDPEATSANVVGMIRGSDPALREEFLVVSAHLDHVGRQGDVVYPGANDNASGSAAVLALAEAFARSAEPPRRSVIFTLFSAEESGLLGATHWVDQPPVPLDRVVALINLDCVGIGNGKLKLGGGKASPQLWELARSLDTAGFTVEETWYGGGADATPFFEAGIPTLYFATEDAYAHLHRPTDTPDTLDPDLLTEVTRLAHRTAAAVARGEYDREERVPREGGG